MCGVGGGGGGSGGVEDNMIQAGRRTSRFCVNQRIQKYSE